MGVGIKIFLLGIVFVDGSLKVVLVGIFCRYLNIFTHTLKR